VFPDQLAFASSVKAADVVALFRTLAFARRLHTFFDSTSWSMCLSRLRSATSCFNFRFSCRSCRSSLSSAGVGNLFVRVPLPLHLPSPWRTTVHRSPKDQPGPVFGVWVNSTWDEPHLFSTDVIHVLVNGSAVLRDAGMTGEAPGMFVRR